MTAACRGCSRESTRRAAPAPCGWRTTWSAAPRPCRAVPSGSDRSSVTRRKRSPADVRDAVVQREPLVHEGVIRPSAGRGRCDRRGGCCSTNSSISSRNAARRLSSKFGKMIGSGSISSSARIFSHWNAKLFVRATPTRGSASSRRTCASRTAGVFSVPFSAAARSSSSGARPIRKNERREASSKSADCVNAPGCETCRRSLGAIQELRARENRRQRVPNRRVEVADPRAPRRRSREAPRGQPR